jgi:serine/threonine protein kinase
MQNTLTLIRSLGEGGFGTTDLVERDGQRYVLKRLKPSAIAGHGTTAIALFTEEANYLKTLGTHPQIPSFIDSGTDSDGSWILQEYIPGENLEQILSKQHVFSEAEVIKLLNSLLPVIQFIHSQNAIHRDVKPANIIWHDGKYYLVDFGASKRVSETVLRKTGTVIGSAGYAAPEQTIGKATFSSDIFSLGVTCLHLLTGQDPFELIDFGENKWNWRFFLRNGHSDTQDLPPVVSEGFGLVLDKMIEHGTYRRYVSVDEVIVGLNQIDRRTIARQRVTNIAKIGRSRTIAKWAKRGVKTIATAIVCFSIVKGVSTIPKLIPTSSSSITQLQHQIEPVVEVISVFMIISGVGGMLYCGRLILDGDSDGFLYVSTVSILTIVFGAALPHLVLLIFVV